MNIPQPPDLLHLYRDFYNRVVPSLTSIDNEIQTDLTSDMVTQLERDVSDLKSVLVSTVQHVLTFYQVTKFWTCPN